MKGILIRRLGMYLLIITMIAGCSHTETEDIDGGTRHYVDEGAPKTIESTRIVAFSCEFSAYNLSMDTSPVAGRYHTLYAGEDSGSYEARGGGEVFAEREFSPDEAFFDALQQIVAKHDLAQYNGQFYTVAGLPPDHGARLDIQYDSGESIRSSDNQSCFIPLGAMEELVELFYPQDSQLHEQE